MRLPHAIASSVLCLSLFAAPTSGVAKGGRSSAKLAQLERKASRDPSNKVLRKLGRAVARHTDLTGTDPAPLPADLAPLAAELFDARADEKARIATIKITTANQLAEARGKRHVRQPSMSQVMPGDYARLTEAVGRRQAAELELGTRYLTTRQGN